MEEVRCQEQERIEEEAQAEHEQQSAEEWYHAQVCAEALQRRVVHVIKTHMRNILEHFILISQKNKCL